MLVSPFAFISSQEVLSFSLNLSPKSRMFASPDDYVREPLQVGDVLALILAPMVRAMGDP